MERSVVYVVKATKFLYPLFHEHRDCLFRELNFLCPLVLVLRVALFRQGGVCNFPAVILPLSNTPGRKPNSEPTVQEEPRAA
jgi:hypothetical protein